MKDKTVFVVHGRNKRARNAMFTFLRSLGLRPLEWEQARAMTNQPTPTTIEIVKAGIEASQSVVVLFTGDDEARLRPEYGDEDLTPQPRPNVIFEAGWGLAVAGQEATILVRLGAVREFSDIDGLNQIHLTNQPASRRALVERLRDAGCVVDDSGSDYLNPATGGDFDPDYLDPDRRVQAAPDPGTDRGTFTHFVVDSALLYRVKSLDLWRNLSADLNRGSRIDLKHHYIGATCAGYWLKLVDHPVYGHRRLRNTIEAFAPAVFEEVKQNCDGDPVEVDVISLGPGDGLIDSRLLFWMASAGIDIPYYYCIDLSFELLQQAVSNIVDAGFLDTDRMRVKAIYGDFTEMERLAPIYKWDPTTNLFSLLGNTVGNYSESFLLRSVRAGMNVGDFLLLDARLHSLGGDRAGAITDDQKESILAEYKHRENDIFAFGPVEMATSATSEDVTFGYDLNRRITDVPGAINIITYCEGLDARLRGEGVHVTRDHLELAATTRYSYDELRSWLRERGFRVVWSERSRDGDIGLFLLQKMP